MMKKADHLKSFAGFHIAIIFLFYKHHMLYTHLLHKAVQNKSNKLVFRYQFTTHSSQYGRPAKR